MNKQQQEQSYERFIAKQRQTLLSKGDDYAGEDRLSNFKRVGNITGQSAEQACLSLIATKVARLSELFTGKTPKNEAVEDSILDLATYSVLLNMIREDSQGEKTCGLDTTYREPKHGPAICWPRIDLETQGITATGRAGGQDLSTPGISGHTFTVKMPSDFSDPTFNCGPGGWPEDDYSHDYDKDNLDDLLPPGIGPLGKIPMAGVIGVKAKTIDKALKKLKKRYGISLTEEQLIQYGIKKP